MLKSSWQNIVGLCTFFYHIPVCISNVQGGTLDNSDRDMHMNNKHCVSSLNDECGVTYRFVNVAVISLL